MTMNLVDRARDWANAQTITPLSAQDVPGTSDSERRQLAAIGGIGASLAGERCEAWPQSLREWAKRGPLPPADLVEAIRRELTGGRDVLASLYEAIVSGENRRRLGTFFTPPAVVDFMLDRAEAILETPSVVIDPGAGVGAFSLAARRRWPDARVVAVDVNVVTLGLLAARPDSDVELVHADYLEWARGPAVPGAKPRLWIGNPPYTRHQHLTRSFKDRAIEASAELVKSGLAGLSAYFLATTLHALAPEDVLCFLLPGSWTDARYGRPLRNALRAATDRPVEFIGFSSDVDVFPGTRVTAMVTVVGPSERGQQPLTTATAKLEPGAVVVGRSVRHDRTDGAIEGLGTWLWRRTPASHVDGVPLHRIARVRRGVATGANEFFLLTNEARARLPAAATVRAVRRLRYLAGDRLTLEAHDGLAALGERSWLVVLADPGLQADPAVAAWLDSARKSGVKDRYLPSHRDPWYLVEDVEAPDVIISPMGKGRMRAVFNEAKAIHSNALYGIYLDGKDELGVRLTAWLNSPDGQLALLERARAYGAGLFKLEPRDLLTVTIPTEVLEGDLQTSR
jgi:adenine-specific DNA-methyltransferase